MSKRPELDASSLGNILLKLPSVTSEDIAKALEFQRCNKDLLLGETMVRLGIITRHQLDAAVIMQRRMRKQTLEVLDYAVQRTKSITRELHTITALSTDMIAKMRDIKC